MASGPTDTRVLVVTDEDDGLADGSDIASTLVERLPGQTVIKGGTMAIEYLEELGPTVDCVVALGCNAPIVQQVSQMGSTIPLVVYGGDLLDAHVNAVIPPTAGVDDLVGRIQEEVSQSRETNHLEEVNAKLTALARYAKQITGCETVQDVCDRTVGATLDALDFDFCILALVEGDQIVPYGSTLPMEAQQPIDIDEGIAGRTLEAGEAQVVADMQSDADAAFKECEFRSVLSVPVGDRGVLQVVSNEEGIYGDRDVEFLGTLAGYTNEALARLEREAALREERDQFHAFFEALPAPAVYVESETLDEGFVRETNVAYERTFPDGADAHGKSVTEAFPTECERTLVADHLCDTEPASKRIERTVQSGETKTLSVTFVPVEKIGQSASGYLVYVPGGDSL